MNTYKRRRIIPLNTTSSVTVHGNSGNTSAYSVEIELEVIKKKLNEVINLLNRIDLKE